MARHRHVLTLRFLVDLDDEDYDQSPASRSYGTELVQERLARALRNHPAAQWALLALALGPLAAAETEDALAGALDMTPQRAVGVLTELCELSDDESASLEQAAMHGTLVQSVPLLREALRVLLLDAELYRVVELGSLEKRLRVGLDSPPLNR